MPLSSPLEPSPAADRISAEFEPAGPPSSSKAVDTGFTVQVAASHIKHDAEALVAILKDRGYPVFLVAPEHDHSNDNLFRVQVGPFASRDEAEKVRTKLAKEGLFRDLFIRH
jgi:DedD protein